MESSVKSREVKSWDIPSATNPIAVKAIVIDLDGTLLHTAPDIAEAANRMLAEMDLPQLDQAVLESYIGNGLAELVKRALTRDMNGKPESALFERGLDVYVKHYADVINRSSTPYSGVMEGLNAMRQAGYRLACVTNKVESFTLPLLKHTGLSDYFELVVSGDSLPRKKPDPMPLLHVCEKFGIAPHELLLIGDSHNDAQAARAAGCPVFCVPYGYNGGVPVGDLDQDAVVDSLYHATELIRKA